MPSGLNATLTTASVWPVSGCADGSGRCRRPTAAPWCPRCRRRCACPSGLNATLTTRSVWPVSGSPTGWRVSASHSRTVWSQLPEAIRVPSGLNATLATVSVWPVSGCADRFAGVRVPQPHGLVVAAGDDAVPVGAERHAAHPVGVAGQRVADRLPGGRIPQPHGVVLAAGGDALAVGAERHAGHSDPRLNDLECVDRLHQRIEQWTVIRRLRKPSCHEQLLRRRAQCHRSGHRPASTGPRRPTARPLPRSRWCIASCRWRFASCCFTNANAAAATAMTVSMARPMIAARRRRRNRRCSRTSSLASSYLDLPWIGAARSVTLSRNTGACGIPRRIPADVDIERLGGQHPRLGQHRQRGIRPVRVKPCRVASSQCRCPWPARSTVGPAPRCSSQ